MLFTLDASPVRALQIVTVTSAILLGCGAALLANALGCGRLASLAAVPVVVATGIGAIRITSYRPEAFAFGVVFLLVALGVDWLRHDDRGSLAAACLLTAVLSRVHGIALLTAGAFFVGSAVALFPREGRLRFLRGGVLAGLALGASGLISAVTFGGASGAAHAGNLSDQSGLSDPTWEFIRAIRALPPSMPPSNRAMASGAVETAYEGSGWWLGLALVVAAGILLLGAIRGSKVARQMLAFTLASLAGLTMVAAIFALGWSSYVPRRTGASRLVQEGTLLAGPFIAGGLLTTVRMFEQRIAWQRGICLGTIAMLCGAGFATTSHLESIVAHQRPDRSVEKALTELEVSPNALVLTNAYTEGYVEQVMGAQGLLEGRAPYTFPDVLARANALLRESAAFYAHPVRKVEFLTDNRVSYVVASNRHSYSLGTGNVFEVPVRRPRLDACPRLVRVLTQPGLTVYRVTDKGLDR
jgi:hypothetical protein